MNIPNLTIEELLEAGVHLGHKTLRWNPKMKKYIFGKRDSIHIIDLTQTLELTNEALKKVYRKAKKTDIENQKKIIVKPSQIDLGKEIKKIGSYDAQINLHAEIQAKIHIEVVKEEGKV